MKSDLEPDRLWWTPQEIADAALPGLPNTRRGVNIRAKAERWNADPEFFRRRSGKGGGFEYHWSLLPVAARSALLITAKDAPASAQAPDRDQAWVAYEARPANQKAKALDRLTLVQEIEALEGGGITRREAVRQISALRAVSERTIWSWFALIEGVSPEDRLAYLVPQHRMASNARAELDPEFFGLVMSDYLRPSPTSLSASYRRAARVAKKKGLPVAPIQQVRREKARRISKATEVLAKKGVDALKRLFPSQTRDKTALHAMEAVNGDFHKFDVFVRWPDEAQPIRPQMVAFQDVFSGRILCWRVDKTPNSHAVQLAIGDMVEDWGIPGHVLLDNGREFAAKMITGGAANRFRFKVREDDIPGLLTSLGCEIHWATPYSGQSKPIERAFRDMCDDIAMDPRFDGAYTGNSPDKKPENYGNRAVPLEEFLAVLAEGIEAHNTRMDRRSEVACGRSFAAVFDESYATAPIRKATAEQRRMWLLGAEGVRVHRRNGSIKFMGNVYFDPVLHNHLGEKVIARFDTGALYDGLHVYTLSEQYIGHVECQQKVGFFDVEEGRQQLRIRKAWMKAEKERLAALQLEEAADLGAMLDDAAPIAPAGEAAPEAKVVRMVRPDRPRPQTPSKPPLEPSDVARIEERFAERAAKAEAEAAEGDPRQLFKRAMSLEAAIANGDELTRDQRRWLASFQGTPDYRTWKEAVDEHGVKVLG